MRGATERWTIGSPVRPDQIRAVSGPESKRHSTAVDREADRPDRGESLLDAALTLAHVALLQRDEAGILCYDDTIVRWLPPRGGRGQLNRTVALADLNADGVLTLDARPERLTAKLVSEYLAIKARRLL